MRICFIQLRAYELFNPSVNTHYGGAEVQMHLYAVELAKNPNTRVDFITGNYGQPETETYDNVRLLRSSSLTGSLAQQMRDFYKAFRKSDADVYVQMTLTRFSFIIALLCRLSQKKFIYLVSHDDDLNGNILKTSWLLRKLSLLVYVFANKIVAQNEHQQKVLRNYHIDSKIIRSSLPGTAIKTASEGYHLWIARAERWKQPEVFLRLAEKNPGKKFVMVCPKFAETNEFFYKIISDKAKLLSNVRFYETYTTIEETEKLFADCHTFVNTSESEGFPTTFLHAAKFGKPVLSLMINPDNMLHIHSTGFSSNNDEALLQQKLDELCGNSELYNKMSTNAIAYFNEHHNPDINAGTLYKYIMSA